MRVTWTLTYSRLADRWSCRSVRSSCICTRLRRRWPRCRSSGATRSHSDAGCWDAGRCWSWSSRARVCRHPWTRWPCRRTSRPRSTAESLAGPLWRSHFRRICRLLPATCRSWCLLAASSRPRRRVCRPRRPLPASCWWRRCGDDCDDGGVDDGGGERVSRCSSSTLTLLVPLWANSRAWVASQCQV